MWCLAEIGLKKGWDMLVSWRKHFLTIAIFIFGLSFFPSVFAHPCADYVLANHGFSGKALTNSQIFIRPLNYRWQEPSSKENLKNGITSNRMLDNFPLAEKEFRYNFGPQFSFLRGELYQVDILKSDGHLESFRVLLPAGQKALLGQFKQALIDYIPEDFLSYLDIIRLNPTSFTENPAWNWDKVLITEKFKRAGYIVNYVPVRKHPRHLTANRLSEIEIFNCVTRDQNDKALSQDTWPRRLANALAYNFLERAEGLSGNIFEYFAPIFDVNIYQDKYFDLTVAERLAGRIHKGHLTMGASAFLRYLHPRLTASKLHPGDDFSGATILSADLKSWQAYYRDAQGGHTIPIILKGTPLTDPASQEILRYHLEKIVERLPHHWRQKLAIHLHLNPTIDKPQVRLAKTTSEENRPRLILKFSPQLIALGAPTLNATAWANLIERALGEPYNDAFFTARQMDFPGKIGIALDPSEQFWSAAKTKAWHAKKPAPRDWFVFPKVWLPTYQRFQQRSVKFKTEKPYTAKTSSGQVVHLAMYNQKLMAASKDIHYVTKVSVPADLPLATRIAAIDTVKQILAQLPVQIPLLQNIKILPQDYYPRTDLDDVTQRSTVILSAFRGHLKGSRQKAPHYNYSEEIIIGNFFDSQAMFKPQELADQIYYGLAMIINNGLFKDAHHVGYPDDDFLALLPSTAAFKSAPLKKHERRALSIEGITYYLTHRFAPNYDPAQYRPYQRLFNFLDNLFVAREAALDATKRKIDLSTARDSALWQLLPIVYEEQHSLAQHGQRHYDLFASTISQDTSSFPAQTALDFADLGEIHDLGLDQLRYGIDSFLAANQISPAKFLAQVATIDISLAKAPPTAKILTGKVMAGQAYTLAYTDTLTNGRHHVVFYLNRDLFHTHYGQAKVLFTQAWQKIWATK